MVSFMKLTFSSRNVNRSSFLEMCKFAYDYGYAGFEIFDAKEERMRHSDSILKNDASDAKRKLHNRGLTVSALTFPVPVESDGADAAALKRYVDMAASAEIANIIICVKEKPELDALREKLAPAIERATETDTRILFETCGYLADTQKVIDIINYFAAAPLGAAWNMRETYFTAGETAEKTIETLGAHICYVRMGDRAGDTNVLIGEGELPVGSFINALRSLNYDGFVCVDWNDEITDADIVLTHFTNYIAGIENTEENSAKLYYNRAHTGTFPWKSMMLSTRLFHRCLTPWRSVTPTSMQSNIPPLIIQELILSSAGMLTRLRPRLFLWV